MAGRAGGPTVVSANDLHTRTVRPLCPVVGPHQTQQNSYNHRKECHSAIKNTQSYEESKSTVLSHFSYKHEQHKESNWTRRGQLRWGDPTIVVGLQDITTARPCRGRAWRFRSLDHSQQNIISFSCCLYATVNIVNISFKCCNFVLIGTYVERTPVLAIRPCLFYFIVWGLQLQLLALPMSTICNI